MWLSSSKWQETFTFTGAVSEDTSQVSVAAFNPIQRKR